MNSPVSLRSGTVQAYLLRESPWFMHHFGRAQYEDDKPVVSESIRTQAQPIIDRMNRGELSDEEARRELDKIHY